MSNIEIRSLNEIIHIVDVAGDFWDISEVGDSLFKPKNLNFVYLFEKDTILKLPYLHVPISVLNSTKWPEDLKTN